MESVGELLGEAGQSCRGRLAIVPRDFDRRRLGGQRGRRWGEERKVELAGWRHLNYGYVQGAQAGTGSGPFPLRVVVR